MEWEPPKKPLGAEIASTARKLLSVPKAFLSASVVSGTMSSEQLGIPDTLRPYSNSWEVVLSRGIFFDFGNVFDTNCKATQVICSDLDFGELRYSVDFGVTWITGFGPLTFSIAQPLNDERSDQSEVFQFSLGQGF